MEGDAGCYYHSGSSNDWDLNAVVRYACGGRVPPPSSDDPFSSFLQPPAPDVTDNGMPDATASLPLLDLPVSDYPAVVDELFNAFFAQSAPPQQQPAAPVATNERTPQQQPAAEATNQSAPQLQPALDDPPPSIPQPTGTGRHASGGQGQRSRRKKKQVKKVVQRVAADGTTADPWAWRKYGQKPIKGSPYPRGYYRCSTDKACEARKMVERCSTDPDSFILTYTGGDHNHPVPIHRNSLAGTTRNRQQPSPNAPEPAAVGQSAPAATATEAAAALSPAQSTSGGMSPTTSPRSPSMEEYHQEEDLDEAGASLLPKDVEMAGEEDELLTSFLNPCYEPAIDGSVSFVAAEDGHGGAGIMSPLLNVVQETFVVTPWVTTALDDGDATGWS